MRAAALVPLLLVAGCADLASFELGRCGNGIIDEKLGEDCDTWTDGNTECGTPATRAECRFVCGALALSRDTECPSNWGCGTDGVCREPSGTFDDVAVEARLPFSGFDYVLGELRPVIADFDGDGLADLISFPDRSRIEVAFTRPGELFSVIESIETGKVNDAIIADLDGDRRSDVVVAVASGIQVFTGTAGASLSSVLEAVPDTALGLFSEGRHTRFLLRSADENGGADFLEIVDTESSTGPRYVLSQPFVRFSSFPALGLAIEPEANEDVLIVAIADLDDPPARRDEEFAVAHSDGTAIYVFSAGCALDIARNRQCLPSLRSTVRLPEGQILGQTPFERYGFFADVDGDQRRDLVIDLDLGVSTRTAVAYGDGRGHFCRSPIGSGECAAEDVDRAGFDDEIFAPIRRDNVLAFIAGTGDFNADGRADYVSTDGELFISELPGLAVKPILRRRTRFPAARVSTGDFNGDGIEDVVARGVLVLGSRDGFLNPSRIEVERLADCAAVEDFDGDFADDCALIDFDVRILYGGPGGFREPPVWMGTLPGVGSRPAFAGQVIDGSGAGLTSALIEYPDHLADLVIMTSSGAVVLAGSGERRMLSKAVIDAQASVAQPIILYAGKFSPSERRAGLLSIFYEDPGGTRQRGPFFGYRRGLDHGHFTAGTSIDDGPLGCGAITRTLVDGNGRECGARAVLPLETHDVLAGAWYALCSSSATILRFTPVNECISKSALFTYGGPMLVGDADGDGRAELVLGSIAPTQLGVYFGGRPIFEDAPLAFELSLAAGETIRDWTFLHGGELAALVSGGDAITKVVRARLSSNGLETTGTLQLASPLPENTRFARSRMPLDAPLDVDADGLEDLVLEIDHISSRSLAVFLQRPVRE